MADEVVATEAPAILRLRRFIEWVGSGQPVTQTGRIRRADALALVEALDTGDVLDPRYPIQSSAELPGLGVLVEWAKRCGLVRVVRGRIVAVNRHAHLLDEPPALVARMLDSLPRVCGELGCSVVMADSQHTVDALFGELVGGGSTMAVARGCELAWNTAMLRYWFPDATEQQLEFQRRRSDGDVRWLLATVAELGVLTVNEDTVALTAFGERCLRAHLGLGTSEARCLSVKVTLRDSASPVIWRRLRVPCDIRLDRFHEVLQAAMGWQDCHLHVFERAGERYGHADPDLDIEDERATTLGHLLSRAGDRLDYEYDFGDGWGHEIALETIGDPDDRRARCLDGAGRCPPEDVGGIPGYDDLKRALADPGHQDHDAMLDWLGLADARGLDPDRFAPEEADAAVASVPANRFR